MKNYRTPRTLAESQFETGYRAAYLPRRYGWRDVLPVVGVLALFAFIGVLLALGV